MTKSVVIIDYGHGNANSIKIALEAIGASSIYSSQASDIAAADYLILPGVGHHGSAMTSLLARKLIDPLEDAVMRRGTPVLGICLGMQLMTRSSEEGGAAGLAWVPAETTRIRPADKTLHKVPHVGWNTVRPNPASRLMRGIDAENEPFYFCHSFAIESVPAPSVNCAMVYDKTYVAIFETRNIFGVQFHPEKSQDCGLQLLKNFLSSEE